MPVITDEQFQVLREVMESSRQTPKVNDGLPDPSHRGVVDQSYVRGSDVREFPKMVYRASARDQRGYETKIVKSEEEQSALGKGWLVSPKEIHALLDKINKARLGEVEDVEVKEK